MKINIVLDIVDTPNGKPIEYNRDKIKRWLDSLLEYGENSLVDCDIISFSEYKEDKYIWKKNSGVEERPSGLDYWDEVEIKLRSGVITNGSAGKFEWRFLQYYIDNDIVEYRLLCEGE